MKIFIRIIRVIFGIALLAGFAYGLLTFAKAAPKASDFKTMAAQENAQNDVSTVSVTPGATDAAQPGEVSSTETTSAAPVVESAPSPTPLPDTPAGRAAALGLPAPPQIDINSWEYVLVNGKNSIDQYEPETFGYLNPTIDAFDVQTNFNADREPVDVRIAQALLDFCVAAENEGMNVYLTSGYRSYQSQQDNFTRVCVANGITDGKDKDGHYITMPAGCSEHQTGLCCDIVDRWYATLRPAEQKDKPLQIWLAAHCQEYGFILRFPEGKEEITEVMYEPWHFRYVGTDAAKYIMENNLCLEEFVALYKGSN